MKKLILILLLGMTAGCAASTQWVTFPSSKGDQGVSLDVWLQEHPMKPGEQIRIEELSRGETASSHIVVIKDREPLHIHANHDLIAIVLKGRGTFGLGNRLLKVKPGAVVTVPRGVPHFFVNESTEPAAAYVLFTPPFDGKDTVLVEETISKVMKKK